MIQSGVLVECDPSIKAIILKIDQDKHDYIVEDLDDQTLVIKESQLQRLKGRLEEVNSSSTVFVELCYSVQSLSFLAGRGADGMELIMAMIGIGEYAADAGR